MRRNCRRWSRRWRWRGCRRGRRRRALDLDAVLGSCAGVASAFASRRPAKRREAGAAGKRTCSAALHKVARPEPCKGAERGRRAELAAEPRAHQVHWEAEAARLGAAPARRVENGRSGATAAAQLVRDADLRRVANARHVALVRAEDGSRGFARHDVEPVARVVLKAARLDDGRRRLNRLWDRLRILRARTGGRAGRREGGRGSGRSGAAKGHAARREKSVSVAARSCRGRWLPARMRQHAGGCMLGHEGAQALARKLAGSGRRLPPLTGPQLSPTQ